MGGGGVMRAAAKAAGFGFANAGSRGIPADHTATAAAAVARKATNRPVPAIISSAEDVKSTVLTASQNNKIDAAVQRPSLELHDWEFAGGEEDIIGQSLEPMPRVVFGGVPTLEEAKEATSELKDALDKNMGDIKSNVTVEKEVKDDEFFKIYLSPPNSSGCVDSYLAGYDSALSYPKTKACVTSEVTAALLPQNTLKAFRLLNESPEAQKVVASLASDQNVWNAVLQNSALTEYIQSQKSNTDPDVKESVADGEFPDHQSPKNDDDAPDAKQSADSGNEFVRFLQRMNSAVVDMVTGLSDYFKNLFGGATAEKTSIDADGSGRTGFADGATVGYMVGLAFMVIIMVVLKRH
ncbi:uncharacterized protein LOC127811471 isoform X2 [Diospyros lotus]|uniref:uncharacterized protein LOC127811471 isoform X2 n=1 Tax=Diospyros lotus TaxID=55363 RepID=UPI0022537294|nr:uncharacterized protein LOC127811471 isoform X2 [Diospyros lotus]